MLTICVRLYESLHLLELVDVSVGIRRKIGAAKLRHSERGEVRCAVPVRAVWRVLRRASDPEGGRGDEDEVQGQPTVILRVAEHLEVKV